MIGFWILAALLLLAAFGLFAPVLLSRARGAAVDRQRLNLLLHRQRREELEREYAGKELESLQKELDEDLLGDLAAAEKKDAGAETGGRGGLIFGLIAAPVLGVLLYSLLGRYDLANFSAEPEKRAETAAAPEIREMIDRLAERLKKEPGDFKGWMLLGRSYQQTGEYDKAVDAYARALKLQPDNLDIKSLYAESLGEDRGGNYAGEPAQIAAEILARDPKHRNALWLAGAAAAQGGDARKAIAYLETLRAQFPKDSPDDKHLGEIIGELKGEQTAGAGADANAPGAKAGNAMPETGEQKSIRVKVSLSAPFKARADADDTVFIFARAASGPPMPLAIVRRKVKDLPVEVTLDDSMSMVQGMNLSAFDQLVIGARISKTGQALPKPGDLQGLTKPLEVENGGSYAVEIGEEVR